MKLLERNTLFLDLHCNLLMCLTQINQIIANVLVCLHQAFISPIVQVLHIIILSLLRKLNNPQKNRD